jgi:MFS family permease
VNMPDADRAFPSPLRAWLIVSILIFAMLVSYVDRQIVAIVVGPMKLDLHASDSTIGWLYGIFALFYAVGGVPLAMFADRYTRSRLIAAGIFLWSIATCLCGLTRNFSQLLLTRIGVGVGEACLSPATSSLIADLFPRERIPLVVSAFQAGATTGSGLAFIVGGLILSLVQSGGSRQISFLGDLHPWQQVFVFCGLPGLVLAPMMLLFKDPPRRGTSGRVPGRQPDATSTNGISLISFYRTNKATLLLHHSGFLCLALMGFGFVFWSVSFLSRVHGIEPAKAAQIFGFIQIIVGPLGNLAAPALALRLSRRGHRDANIVASMIGGGCAMLAIMLIQAMPTATLALICFVPALFFTSSPFGLAYGSLPVITPGSRRAVVTSVFMLVVSLGMLLGPPLAGLFNERIFPSPTGVRWSLLTLTPILGITGLCLLALCRRHYAISLARAESAES